MKDRAMGNNGCYLAWHLCTPNHLICLFECCKVEKGWFDDSLYQRLQRGLAGSGWTTRMLVSQCVSSKTRLYAPVCIRTLMHPCALCPTVCDFMINASSLLVVPITLFAFVSVCMSLCICMVLHTHTSLCSTQMRLHMILYVNMYVYILSIWGSDGGKEWGSVATSREVSACLTLLGLCSWFPAVPPPPFKTRYLPPKGAWKRINKSFECSPLRLFVATQLIASEHLRSLDHGECGCGEIKHAFSYIHIWHQSSMLEGSWLKALRKFSPSWQTVLFISCFSGEETAVWGEETPPPGRQEEPESSLLN